MAKIDTEVLFYKLKDFIQANISGLVDSINTEKNDGLLIVAPEADAYIDHSLNDKAMNYDPFIFMHIDSNLSEVNQINVKKTTRFEICYFVARSGEEEEYRIGLRYMRLMEDISRMAWDKAFRGFRYEIETLTPVDVQLANSTKWHRVYAVAVTVTLS